MIGFNRRFDPNFAALKKRLEAGAVGKVEIVTIISRDPGPPPISYIERSGGLFRDMMIHDLDMARFLLGEEPVEVHAIGSVLVDPAIGKAGDVDTAMVMLKHGVGQARADLQLAPRHLRLRPAHRGARLERHAPRRQHPRDHGRDRRPRRGFATDPVQNFFLERYAEAYRAELAAFIDAVRDGKPPRRPARTG